jgi:hypothetical protein
MTRWLKRLRGALGMGLIWALTWAATGVLIGATSLIVPGPFWDAFFAVFDAPLPALGVPGFVGGVLFSLVLGVAGRRRRFHELSLPRFAVLGAIGGLLLSLIPAIALAEASGSALRLVALIAVPLTGMSALSASGTLLLARRAERHNRLHNSRDEMPQLADGN